MPEERFINGDDTIYSQLQNETMSTLDESMFMRHGDIDEVDFKVRLDFLRDFNNKLKLLTDEDEVVFREMLERDTTRQQFAKLATRNFALGGDAKVKALVTEAGGTRFSSGSETMQKANELAAAQMPLDCNLDDFCFQVYIEVELILNDTSRGPKLYTGTLYGYELDQTLTFPLKIRDLPPLARLGI